MSAPMNGPPMPSIPTAGTPTTRTPTALRPVAAVAVAAALVAVHAVAVAAVLGEPGRVAVVHEVAGWVAALVGLGGTVTAARLFERGDHLRTVWGARAVASSLLVVSTALASASVHVDPGHLALLGARALVVLTSNALSVYALALLARTYQQSGLRPPLTWRFGTLWALLAVLAVAVTLPSLRQAVDMLGAGTESMLLGVRRIAGTLGDMGTLLLVAPLLQVAYLMRGGRLAWVWWAMGLAGASWLVYDAAAWLSGVLPGTPAHTYELLLVARSAGLTLVGLAGWLQREALATTGAPTGNAAAVERRAA